MVSKREAITKALIWRFFISIPAGTFISYLWLGEILRSISLMVFMNIVFTIFHFFYEMFWGSIWKTISNNNNHAK